MNFQNLMQSIIEGYNQGVTEMCNPNPQQNEPQGYGQGVTPVYSSSTRRNDPQGCDQGGTYLHNPGPISIVPVSERVPGYFDLPTVRSEDNETVTVREFSGKLYVETENARPQLILEKAIKKIRYVRPDKLYNRENFYIVEFRNNPHPIYISEKDFYHASKFLNLLAMGCNSPVKLYKRSGQKTAELLRSYFSANADTAEIRFYCGWLPTEEGWKFILANGKTHGMRPLDFASDKKAMKPALDDNKAVSNLWVSAELYAAERCVTMMETIQSTAQRGVIFLWLHISALYSLLEGLGFRFPLGFCLFSTRVNPNKIMKKLLEWYDDPAINLSDKKDCLIKSILERKDQPLFLCDNGENSDNISTLIQVVQTGMVSWLRNSEEQSKLQAAPVVLTNIVSPLLVSPYFFILDLSTVEFAEDAFKTVSSLHKYLPDYFRCFSSFLEKNIDLLQQALNRGMQKALSLADEWEISEDGCTSLGIFYGVAEIVSKYYDSLAPQPELARRMNHIFGEDWVDFLRQEFQNNADCMGNLSDLAKTFMTVAGTKLLHGNFEKKTRNGRSLNNDETTGNDGVVYMDDQFYYFTRMAFSSVCKACGASGPAMIHALRNANLLHGQSVNSSTVMTRITTYDIYGCARSERVYKFKQEDIAEANVNMNYYQGGLR